MWIKQRVFDKKNQEWRIKPVWWEKKDIKEAEVVAEETSVTTLEPPTLPISYSGVIMGVDYAAPVSYSGVTVPVSYSGVKCPHVGCDCNGEGHVEGTGTAEVPLVETKKKRGRGKK